MSNFTIEMGNNLLDLILSSILVENTSGLYYSLKIHQINIFNGKLGSDPFKNVLQKRTSKTFSYPIKKIQSIEKIFLIKLCPFQHHKLRKAKKKKKNYYSQQMVFLIINMEIYDFLLGDLYSTFQCK